MSPERETRYDALLCEFHPIRKTGCMSVLESHQSKITAQAARLRLFLNLFPRCLPVAAYQLYTHRTGNWSSWFFTPELKISTATGVEFVERSKIRTIFSSKSFSPLYIQCEIILIRNVKILFPLSFTFKLDVTISRYDPRSSKYMPTCKWYALPFDWLGDESPTFNHT